MKSPFKVLAVVGASLAFLSGCAQVQQVNDVLAYTSGVEVTPQMVSSLKIGKTKQDDIVAKIGYPATRTEFKGREVWSYPYTKVNAIPGIKDVSKTVVFEFNSKGVLLKHFQTNSVAISSGNPLVDAANGVAGTAGAASGSGFSLGSIAKYANIDTITQGADIVGDMQGSNGTAQDNAGLAVKALKMFQNISK